MEYRYKGPAIQGLNRHFAQKIKFFAVLRDNIYAESSVFTVVVDGQILDFGPKADAKHGFSELTEHLIDV